MHKHVLVALVFHGLQEQDGGPVDQTSETRPTQTQPQPDRPVPRVPVPVPVPVPVEPQAGPLPGRQLSSCPGLPRHRLQPSTLTISGGGGGGNGGGGGCGINSHNDDTTTLGSRDATRGPLAKGTHASSTAAAAAAAIARKASSSVPGAVPSAAPRTPTDASVSSSHSPSMPRCGPEGRHRHRSPAVDVTGAVTSDAALPPLHLRPTQQQRQRQRQQAQTQSQSQSRTQPREWGPPGATGHRDGGAATMPTLQVAGSSGTYRTAQERRREDLLTRSVARAGGYSTDWRGNVKRRGSDDSSPTVSRAASPRRTAAVTVTMPMVATTRPLSSRAGDHDGGDAASLADLSSSTSQTLAYIHPVQLTDTLTGVSIRYGCDISTLRRMNGLWSSDSIQMREEVVVPLECCTLRGQRLPAAEEAEQQQSRAAARRGRRTAGTSPPRDRPPSSHRQSLGRASEADDDLEADGQKDAASRSSSSMTSAWKHEYYVRAGAAVVEVGRVPREGMGFFPRARRKPDAATPAGTQTGPGPAADDPFAAPLPPPPPSRLHAATSLTSSRRGSLVLSGPGGVGSLDDSRSDATPGPAEDQLNRFVRSHFPKLATQLSARPSNASDALRSCSATAAQHGQPATIGAGGVMLADVGSAVESWVKRLATKARAGLDEAQLALRQAAVAGKAAGHADGPERRSRAARPTAFAMTTGHHAAATAAAAARAVRSEEIELSETPGASPARGRASLSPALPPQGRHDGGAVRALSSGTRSSDDRFAAPRRRRVVQRGKEGV
ncbi:hypothetical protein KEM52_005667 [Ascosphaera acerosa]|nr:hypothetical protein KEM52_005667 [Ascosphaera acerosa]